ncbi:carboxypeptidase regulatory-like domain-containing protein [Aureibaculum sp. A20]|uniref:Carboxypeptidase regulatory-like domain-containing protein n=1 Tax=Aureibaculum flavum TaxID=2795986 RepID=A0ABS0WQX6_9FLAO|nr:carboxypeptidase-like regulatory domain-containing protein [Aureibaculum flavum]MBJ2174384.1 carboxypeptidase regulatory-like domain-containing protein [Aureibaculum flavum]
MIEITNVNGDFIIQGLDAGEYKISIEHYGFDPYDSTDALLVKVGTALDLGTIELLETTS